MCMKNNAPEITFKDVEAFIIEAAWTLQRLPDHELRWFSQQVFWPEILRRHGIDYAETISLARQRRSVRPSRREINRYQIVLDWLLVLDSLFVRKLVFTVAVQQEGIARSTNDRIYWEPVKVIMNTKYSSRHLKRLYINALSQIAKTINLREFSLSA